MENDTNVRRRSPLNQTFWQRLRAKYRVAVINEDTLGEILHVRLSLWNLIIVITSLFLLALLIFALIIWYTPLKSYLPGFNEDIREELVGENARVDSLLEAVSVQSEYLDVVKSVIAGEVEPDSVRSLDSLYVIHQAELLAVKTQIEEDFVTYYESKGKDMLTLFDMAITQDNLQTMLRPVNGVVMKHFAEDDNQGVDIQTIKNDKVMSVLNGTVVSAQYNLSKGWEVIVQHENDYLSIYSGLNRPIVSPAARVVTGEILGSAAEDRLVHFELWHRGRVIDPEKRIAF